MAKKKQASGESANVHASNISGVSGNVQVAGRDIKNTTYQGLNPAEVKQLFDQVYARIDARPDTSPADRQDLKGDVQQIQETITEAVRKNGDMDESMLSRKFRDIARMAPDILEVIVAAVVNPLGGIGVAVQKIAEKAKAETRRSAG